MGREGLLPRTLVVELDGVVIGELYLHVTAGWAQREVADEAIDNVGVRPSYLAYMAVAGVITLPPVPPNTRNFGGSWERYEEDAA